MNHKKRILLKITGELFFDRITRSITTQYLRPLVAQIKKLSPAFQFGIVVGGGNLFRGNVHGKQLGITPVVGHQIGMLATMMNGLFLKDLCEQEQLATAHFCAIPTPEIGKQISQQSINDALADDMILIFSGGTGNPFFTNDTNAVLRGLQINAHEIWKGTNVDGIFDKDPSRNPEARLLSQVTFQYALQEKLGIMDLTAFALAQCYRQRIRVFNIYQDDALLHVAQNNQFGSTLTE